MSNSKKNQSSGVGCVWLVLFLVGVAACVVGIIWLTGKIGLQPPESIPVPGDAAHFDPITAFDEVQKFAGEGVMLLSMDAVYVRSDGTLDLTAEAYRPTVSYEFVRKMTEPPTNAPPVGAGGSVTDEWFEPIEVELSRPGQGYTLRSGGSEVSYVNQGMERDPGTAVNRLSQETIDAPQCSLAKLWEAAIAEDAPRDAVATIRYDADGYTFNISDMSISLEFTPDCELVE
jgi:hypothetical protein